MRQREDYTLKDVLYFLEENSDLKGYNGRKRYILDRRNYIIHILYRKFGLSEEAIGKVLRIKRSAVHHSKDHAWYHNDYEDFQLNTERIRKIFPHRPIRPIEIQPKTYVYKCTVELNEEEYQKILKFRNKHNEIAINKAIKKMIRIY